MKYVAGFLFDRNGHLVMLQRKARPEWQKGRLNGIGGKIELGESPLMAMAREAKEEAGVEGALWEEVAILSGNGFVVYFYAAFDDRFVLLKGLEDEPLYPQTVMTLLAERDLIPNLRVLIPLALDRTGIRKPVLLLDESP